jgi:hypothetical protein
LCIENENFSDFNKQFGELIESLEKVVNFDGDGKMWQNSYMLNVLCGIAELNIAS